MIVLMFLVLGFFVLGCLGYISLDRRLRPVEAQSKTAAKADGFVSGAKATSKRKESGAGDSPVPEVDFDALLYGGRRPPTAPDLSANAKQAAQAAVGYAMPGQIGIFPSNVLANYYFFEVEQPDNVEEAERLGIRIPPDDESIPNLSLDGFLQKSICCRMDANTETCPDTNQMGVVIRGVPDTGDHYLRVAVHNPAYFDVPCVFFWVSINDESRQDYPDKAPPRLTDKKVQ